MKTVRWGIIGVGDVTEVKSGPAFSRIEGSELVAVMRRSGDLAKDYAERHGVPKWYDDADALIHDADVNAVYIATPPDSHLDYTRRIAAAGKPIYVEKPMARTYAECKAMVEACESANVPLFVAYYRRGLPRFLKVKELVDSGAIGEVRFTRMALYEPRHRQQFDPDNLPWRVIPELAGGGIYVDLASHMLDILDYILGPISGVQGYAANQAGQYPAEDIVTGSFVFESGVQGVGTWCFTAHGDVDMIEIAGSDGRVTFSAFADAPVRLITDEGETVFEIANPPHIQQPLIQMAVDELRGEGTCPSTGISAARTSWVMDRMLASYYPDRDA